jgi:hypothetical protein
MFPCTPLLLNCCLHLHVQTPMLVLRILAATSQTPQAPAQIQSPPVMDIPVVALRATAGTKSRRFAQVTCWAKLDCMHQPEPIAA